MKNVEITYRYGDTDALVRPRRFRMPIPRELRLDEGNRVFAGLLGGVTADGGMAHRIIDVYLGDRGSIRGSKGVGRHDARKQRRRSNLFPPAVIFWLG